MPDLQRLTTAYSDSQDRIRLSGEGAEGRTVVLWLTRRLLDRLVPHLILWLEQQQADLPRSGILHEFAQQEAQRQLMPQAPVTATATGELVQSVDITPMQEQLQLVFKVPVGGHTSIGFAATPLRQWLAILYQQYQAAEWPQTPWPEWMKEPTRPGDPAIGQVWH